MGRKSQLAAAGIELRVNYEQGEFNSKYAEDQTDFDAVTVGNPLHHSKERIISGASLLFKGIRTARQLTGRKQKGKQFH
eukprot:817461-Prymnesium_polylepis.1